MLVTAISCCIHTHFSTPFPATLFVPSNCISDGSMVNMQVGSSLTFLCRFQCQQALRLPRLFTECSFLDCGILTQAFVLNQGNPGLMRENL